MPRVIIGTLPMAASEDVMKKFKSGVREFLKRRKAKLAEYSFENGIVSIRVDNDAAFTALCDSLRKFPGASVTTVTDGLEELLLQYAETKTKTK